MLIPLDYRRRGSGKAATQRFAWTSRGILLIAMILFPLAGVLFYSGSAWAAVLIRLVADGAMIAVWLVGAMGLGLFSLRALRLWEEAAPTVLRTVVAAAMGLGIMSLVLLGLGLAGALHAFSAWAIVCVGWMLGGISIRSILRETGFPQLRAWLSEPARWQWLWLLATPFLVLALTAAMTPPGMLWTPEEPHGYDVVEYHLEVSREWYEAGRIAPLHHNVFSYFPFNVEMHYLLAMHLRGGPWAAMYQAQLMHLSFIALTVLAVYGFARRLAQPLTALIAALSLLTVPWLTQLAAIAYDEGGLLLFGTLAIGWAMAATFEPHHRLRRFALAGVMAGFAAGSKLTAVPEVLVAVPIMCLSAAVWMLAWHGLPARVKMAGIFQADRATRTSSASRQGLDARATGSLLLGIAIFSLTGLLCFSPWLERNIAWAHNPVFPELMPLLGHDHFTSTQIQRFELAHKPPPEFQSQDARRNRFVDEILLGDQVKDAGILMHTAWQFGYFLLPIGFIAGIAVLPLPHRRPQALFLLGLLFLLAVFWLEMTHLQSRFFILAAPIAALLLAQIEWRRATFAALALVLVFATIAWININDKLYSRLYETRGGTAVMADYLGCDGAWFYTQVMPPELPKDATVVLVGDARAFMYPIPMSRLRYRTVFDVADGPDLVTAWQGTTPLKTGEWIVIDPAELNRFRRTYFGLPPLPSDIEHANAPIIGKR